MASDGGKKGILGWFTRHPFLAVLSIVFFVLALAIIVALAVSAYSTPVETIYPRKTKRRPTIAGASELIPVAATVMAPPISQAEATSKWKLFLMQAVLVVIGSAFAIYVIQSLINSF